MSRSRPQQLAALLATRPLTQRQLHVALRAQAGIAASPPRDFLSRSRASVFSGPSRAYATSPASGPGGVRISYLFGGLVGLGLLVTTYGLLEYFFSLQTWPEHIRTPLKAAIKARNAGDWARSETYFQKAIEAALSLPSSSLQPDPLQKLTGLYVSYASLLESQGQLVKAYTTLRTALHHLGPTPLIPSSTGSEWAGPSYVLDSADHIRAIGLSQKLGHLALQLSAGSYPPPFPVDTDRPTEAVGWLDAAESYLSGALTAMLKLGLIQGGSAKASGVIAGKDIVLPEGGTEEDGGRVDKRGLGMTMEALSEVYARKKQYEVSAQLLLQAISILLPPGSKEAPPARDRCQAALLMTSISSHTLNPRTPQAIKVSRSWSLQGLQIAESTLAENGTSSAADPSTLICNRARSVALQNMGMLSEIEQDLPTALGYFDKSLAASKEIGFAEGRREAMEAIRRLRNQGVTEPTISRTS
ncbi:uncharacterized protein MKK02DRAFT_30228 [Dioszegia hungarica]|uniref:TPR-like protein n=1 Tax=Dioszegia hungarica TaxID=4972 RepID=A0AA38H4I3_9TREE|nr:uncharacterized protein MKK02DRAFT_30228 [Dioszegia hungarica]KAI9632409.1 hypothetical protein MKK02DRAFT_30228 [Dioszegia hungarica]